MKSKTQLRITYSLRCAAVAAWPPKKRSRPTAFVVDSPIGKIKGNGAFIIKGTIPTTTSKIDSTSKYDKTVGDY
ncbi:MAG: hypothetical protein LBU51_07100 [Bacteroidales bacterium]|jgi:hypothetical protein|nr:hypothetical protein [Bacteroidales bacterium]